MIPIEQKINNLTAEDFLKENISIDYLIKLDIQRIEEIKRGYR